MGESKRRKVDGKYVSFKGDDYKMEQPRMMVRYLRWLMRKNGGGK